MATRADRLQVVVELAEQAENTAAEALNLAREQHQAAEQKLQELNLYCKDYQQSLSTTGISQSADAIVRARGFLNQLTQAVEQQQTIVDQFFKLFEQKKGAWHKAHLKFKALKDLVERIEHEHQQALSKKEEKMLDEWVTMGFARKASDNSLQM